MPILALCSASESLAIVLADALPNTSVKMPVRDANAYASRAIQTMTGIRATRGSDLPDQALADGRRTFDAEPLNSGGVSLMAFGRQANGDAAGARRLYQDALSISKRDRFANMWLLEDASERGRVGDVLDRYDVLLRTGGAPADLLLDVLGTALREDAIVPYLAQRLANRPPWSEAFWLKVTPSPGAIANVGRLRLRLIKQHVPNPAGNDADILRRLVANGQYGIAFSLFDALTGTKRQGSEIVHNANFTQSPRFPPLDWETFTAAGYNAQVDPVSGALTFYVEDSVEAVVARQLMAAAPGAYVLSYRTPNADPFGTTRATVRLRCADDGGEELVSIPITSLAASAPVRLAGGTCGYVWLEVAAAHAGKTAAARGDALIGQISLRASE